MVQRQDYVALEWVKSEIDETLLQARGVLETFVENTEDVAQLRFCLMHIHQVSGTLQMVQFFGAALLGEEMEHFCNAIVDGTIPPDEDNLSLLMQGILQLPNYLERVKVAKKDLPTVLLPLINQFRKVRGAADLSEVVFFRPDFRNLFADLRDVDYRRFDDPRFIGGHPMAGSELVGLAGADASLFEGAVWVLTPSENTPDANFAHVAQVVKELGAEFVVLSAERHDQLVAIVSHLPHLTAATLMSLANDHAEEHVAVLRLAAGGFRDMTRVASGHPAIWLDVCKENREAIIGALDGMISGLQAMRVIVDEGKTDELKQRLQTARVARANLPGRVSNLLDVVEVRVPIPDRAGAAAEIFSLAAELGVNTANFEVAHSVEGDRGILVLVIDRASQDVFKGGLIARGFRPSIQQLT